MKSGKDAFVILPFIYRCLRMDKLVIKNLSKAFGKAGVLHSVSFTVKDGEFLSILGPSGCGKTTILRVLIGLENADSGEIIKDGVDITNLPPSSRKMGIVFGVPAYSLSRRASASPSTGTISIPSAR